jgi:hypothetical protein
MVPSEHQKRLPQKKFPRLHHKEYRQGNFSIYGNTAQFPPCGLSTAPAAAALRIMRYCLIGYAPF